MTGFMHVATNRLTNVSDVYVALTFTLISAGRPPLLIQGCSSMSSRRWSEEK